MTAGYSALTAICRRPKHERFVQAGARGSNSESGSPASTQACSNWREP